MLIQGPLEQIDEIAGTMRKAMSAASSAVLGGVEVPVEAVTIYPGERFPVEPDRGGALFERVMATLDRLAN